MQSMIDLSGLSYFVPVFGFLLVFLIVYALLNKLKIIGDSKSILIFTALSIGVIFVAMTSVRTVVENVVPWFSLLIVAIFFIFIILGFSQGKFEKAPTWLMWVFVAILVAVFVIALARVFNSQFQYFLPSGPYPQDEFLAQSKNFIYSSRFLGSVLLLGIAALVSWIITRK